MEQITEYINLITGLLIAVSAAIPTIIGIWNNAKKVKTIQEGIEAIDGMQVAIGEGGTIYEVVERISELKNKVIEDRLQQNNAKVINSI